MRPLCLAALTVLVASAAASPGVTTEQTLRTGPAPDTYLSWSAKQAETTGRAGYKKGRVGGFWDTRGLQTDRAFSYKLAATWFTPDVIRATARLIQLQSRLSDEQARALVAEAEAVGTVVMVEIDPSEGSGVIPSEWKAFLRPKGQSESTVVGVNTPRLREVKALAGTLRRNYYYDRFWVVFPPPAITNYLRSGMLELIVRIYDKEGRVEWMVPGALAGPRDEPPSKKMPRVPAPPRALPHT